MNIANHKFELQQIISEKPDNVVFKVSIIEEPNENAHSNTRLDDVSQNSNPDAPELS
jgi:hypothetical protein